MPHDGIYICEGGGLSISKSEYNELFQGWGFPFF